LAAARDAFLAALERYTLADLVAPRRKLTALLNPQPRPL
jgi:DNA-binding IscR family transcriptional regulator